MILRGTREQVYIVVKDPSDRLRALKVLHARCILAGFCWWDAKAGEIRSIAGIPSGFIEQANTDLTRAHPDHIQADEVFDTRAILQDLTEEEQAEVERLTREMRGPLQ